MKIAYFGSPNFSAMLLERLILDKSLNVEIALVVTQPDKPVGRKQEFSPSPVKVMAQKYGIEVWDKNIPKSVNYQLPIINQAPISNDQLKLNNSLIIENWKLKLSQIDLCIVFAFGFRQLIPIDLLKAPKIQFDIGAGKSSGFINIHPSLLPRYRGSSPIAYPILLGENKTGVTLFVMDEKMDHGPIIAQDKTEIRLNDVRADMENKLTKIAFDMLEEFFSSTNSTNFNQLRLIQQNHLLATRAPFMTKDDGFIPFSVLQKALKNEPITLQELPHIIRSYLEKYSHIMSEDNGIFSTQSRAVKKMSMSEHECGDKNDIVKATHHSGLIIYNFWRGMHPWPGVWTLLRPEEIGTTEGQALITKSLRLIIIKMKYVANKLQITLVQLEGKKPVDFPTFQKAYSIF